MRPKYAHCFHLQQRHYAMTFDEIGKEFGITKERARQIFNEAMKKLEQHREIKKLALLAEAHQHFRETRIHG